MTKGTVISNRTLLYRIICFQGLEAEMNKRVINMPNINFGNKPNYFGHLLVQALYAYKSDTFDTDKELQTFLSVYSKLKTVPCIQEIIILTFPIALLEGGVHSSPEQQFSGGKNKGKFCHYSK